MSTYHFNMKSRADIGSKELGDFGIFHWCFDLLDSKEKKVDGWYFYCYSQMIEKAEHCKNIVKLVRSSSTIPLKYKPTEQELRSYFDLLDHFFEDRHGLDIDVLVDEVLNHNRYTLSLTINGEIGYAAAVIIRYLWEDPRIVRNFLWLREQFPEEDIGRLFLVGQSQAFLENGPLHNSGHSFNEYIYGRNIAPKKNVKYPEFFKETTPFIEDLKWAGYLTDTSTKWLNRNRVQTYVDFLPDEAHRLEKAKELLS